MKRIATYVAPLAMLALVILSFAPAAAASTLNVDLNPTNGVATMTSTSATKIVFTYPANSSVSQYLNGYSQSNSASGSFDAGSQDVSSLQAAFHDGDGGSISIRNMTVSTSYSAKANTTALVISKETNITATVSGVFKVVNGTVTADLGWRSFYITGPLDLTLQGRVFDINLLGSAVVSSMGGRGLEIGLVTEMFGGSSLWNMPTLNFSALSTPLTTWTKNYNSLTNTTTFSKTIAGQSSLSSTYTENGQTYSLKATSDPNAEIATRGYAVASGNSLTIEATPAYLSPAIWVATAGVIAFVGVAIFVWVWYRRTPAKPPSATVAPL